MVSIASNRSVDDTVERLKRILATRGITLFALVAMAPTKLLIFGNPKAGTPLMQASPSAAIDLPLKILVAEDSGGVVHLSWNGPEFLQHRHGLPPDLLPAIAVVANLAAAAAE
jgi:uncharacterized protein (DUF302 family)